VTEHLRDLVRRALDEDRAGDDVTSRATIPASLTGSARLVANEPCVVAGLDVFEACFTELDPSVRVRAAVKDGDPAEPGDELAVVEGPLRSILAAERTALNFVQRLCGIATLTRAFVARAGRVTILDTRKTTPGLRALEKAAVAAGGGSNHRMDLASAILVKDNHVAAAGGIGPAVAAAKASGLPVEVECDTPDQVREALGAGADAILLDNMTVETLRQAAELVGGRARTEASGGVTLDTVAAIAGTGVDAISVGALTHSARAIDVSLEVP